MRIFVILICSLAVACAAYAQPEQGKPQKKKQGQTAQQGVPPTGHPTGAGAGGKKTSVGPYQVKGNKGQTSVGPYQAQMGKKGQTSVEGYGQHKGKKGQTQMGAYEGQKGKKNQTLVEAYHGQKGKKGKTQMGAYQAQTGKVAKGGKVTGATAATGKPFKPQRFNVAKQPNTAKAPPVKFQQ